MIKVLEKYVLTIPDNDYKKHITTFYKEISNTHLNQCIECNTRMKVPKRKWSGNNIEVVWVCGFKFKLIDPESKYIRPSLKHCVRV